jgi:hypothetical protein
MLRAAEVYLEYRPARKVEDSMLLIQGFNRLKDPPNVEAIPATR